MPRSHYEVLGIGRAATAEQIRSAYRKIVLAHHPDRSSDPRSVEIFIACTSAYEVLSDTEKRRHYDELYRVEQRRVADEKERPQSTGPRATSTPRHSQSNSRPTSNVGPRASAKSRSMTIEVTQLSVMFTRGRIGDAEKLAKKILHEDRRQPIPYAVLGDIARSRGDLPEAARMYAFAAQMDPANPTYQHRHEELLSSIKTASPGRSQPTSEPGNVFPLLLGLGMVVLACVYLVLSRESAIFPALKLISSWTLGLVVMLFLCGVAIGSSLSIGQFVERFQSNALNSLGKLAPALMLALIAFVNFWAAAAMYGILGLRFRSFDYSTTRIVGSVAVGTTLVSLAAILSDGIMAGQVLLWGGNLVYLGALCGWMVADSFRR